MNVSETNEKALEILREARVRQGCLPSTVKVECRLVRAALRALGKGYAEVEPEELQRYVAGRAERLRGSSLNREVSALKAFYRALLEAGAVEVDPTCALGLRSESPRPHLVLSEEVMERLLACALMPNPKSRRSPQLREAIALRNRACLELLYGLGLRATEAANALVVDLDVPAGDLLVRRVKRGENRRLPIPKASLPFLTRYVGDARPLLAHSGKDGGALLVTERGTRFCGNEVFRVVRDVARRAGVRAHPHALRRSLATHMVRRGATATAVQTLLGHVSLETTQRYVTLDQADLRGAIEVLDRLRGE